MSWNLKHVFASAAATAAVGLLGATLAFAQAAPPSPPVSGNPTSGTEIDTTEGETPDATRPGVSASKTPRLGSDGVTPSTRTRPSESRRTTGSTTARGFTPQGRTQVDADSDTDATIDAPGTTRSTRETARDAADDFRDEARETTRDARESADEFRDAARETTREAREDARDTADDFRDDARDTRREVRETADDFRDAARDSDRFDRDSDRNRDERFTDRDRDDRDRSRTDRDDRSRVDVESRTSADFQADRVRSADIGLWFDRGSDDGLVINDIGTGVISRWGFREGDRIYSVNGVRVDSDRDFMTTLFDQRWRNQRANVIIYRHGRPWTVYVHPSQLITEYSSPVQADPLDAYGLVLDDRYDDHVVVWRVTPRSPAYYAGLRSGDVITTFDGRRLSGRDDFVQWVGRGDLDSVMLDINRNRQVRRLDFDLSGARAAGTRTSLRPNLDGRTDIRTDGRTDIRTDGRFDGSLDGRIETDADGRFDARTPGSTIPGRLRGSATGGVEGGVRTVQPGEVQGTVDGAVRGTVQPGRIQGGARSGGLFRGNR